MKCRAGSTLSQVRFRLRAQGLPQLGLSSISRRISRQTFPLMLSPPKRMAHFVAQEISRAVDARLNRPLARLQNRGDLVIALAFDIAEH